jgi:trehalose 6-phosphate phosphatase
MAFEIRPRRATKARPVEVLMRSAPFRGRRPVFVGDDVTDEDGIAAAEALGGVGLRVPEAFGGAPGAVRRFLARGLAAGDWPAPALQPDPDATA